MRKSIFIVLLLVSVVIVSAFMPGKQSSYKNLKVLPKNITKHELDSTMKFWCLSLGVRCEYCHVYNEGDNKWFFDNDGKPTKLMARKMYVMTGKIDKKYFKPEKGEEADELDNNLPAVTCYTCHHGTRDKPGNMPPLPQKKD